MSNEGLLARAGFWVALGGVLAVVGATFVVAAITVDKDHVLMSPWFWIGLPLLLAGAAALLWALVLVQADRLASSRPTSAVTQQAEPHSHGVVAIENRGARDQVAPLSNLIDGTKTEILFIGLNLYKLHSRKDRLKKAAAKHVRIRLLVADPREKHLIEAILAMLRADNHSYLPELLASLMDFKDVWESAAQDVQVRVFKDLPLVSATMVDGTLAEIDVMQPGVSRKDRLVLVFDLSAAQAVKESLDSYWEKAAPLDNSEKFDEAIRAAKALQPV